MTNKIAELMIAVSDKWQIPLNRAIEVVMYAAIINMKIAEAGFKGTTAEAIFRSVIKEMS